MTTSPTVKRYKLPDALGGGEYEALIDFKSKVGDDWRFRFNIPGVGCVDIPAEALTPVKPPTPPEPEPGVYDIGGMLCWNDGKSNISGNWQLLGAVEWRYWDEFCAYIGLDRDPAKPITRLVPERVEPVPLPWTGRSQTGHFIFGVTPCRPGGRDAANVSIDDAMATITPSVAREMAAALLAFANGTAASRAES